MSTVCAISTPQAVGGISVIRISGENAINIAEKIFKPAGDTIVSEMAGNTCVYGKVFSDGKEIDDGVLTVFIAPKSYTGENTAEISCHGGIYVTRQVLRACIKAGAKPAQPGEFTKRAFLNGKLSLTQAEAVMEVISANGEQALRSANLVRDGKLYSKIKAVSDKLVLILSELAAWNDYPDEDLPSVQTDKLSVTLADAAAELGKILESYDTGRVLRNGVDTAIVGRTNVGKSTLMNMLLGYDRSIVTDIAGTTRDIVEESASIGGIQLRLSDTAGIRTSDDTVEGIGIELARKKLTQCDLALAVFDSSQALGDDDIELINSLDKHRTIIILNKCDLEPKISPSSFDGFEHTLEISAKNGCGIELIENALNEMFKLNSFDSSAAIFANERQKECVENALKYITTAADALSYGETLDAVTVMIDKSADCLLELTGEKATEAVVNKVFERFCVGK